MTKTKKTNEISEIKDSTEKKSIKKQEFYIKGVLVEAESIDKAINTYNSKIS